MAAGVRTAIDWCRRVTAARLRSLETASASGARGRVTTTSTSFPEGGNGAAAPPPARSASEAVRASAKGSTERRKGGMVRASRGGSGPRAAATLSLRADVAELVDAHGSGPCGLRLVEVQVLSSASLYPGRFRDARRHSRGGGRQPAQPGLLPRWLPRASRGREPK